jgi:hypothetical protein
MCHCTLGFNMRRSGWSAPDLHLIQGLGVVQVHLTWLKSVMVVRHLHSSFNGNVIKRNMRGHAGTTFGLVAEQLRNIHSRI